MSILVSARPAVTVAPLPDNHSHAATVRQAAVSVKRWRVIAEFLGDGALAIMAVLLIPAAILAIGVPIALVGWALIEILQKLF